MRFLFTFLTIALVSIGAIGAEPRYFSAKPGSLKNAKTQLAAGDKQLAIALKKLVSDANKALVQPLSLHASRRRFAGRKACALRKTIGDEFTRVGRTGLNVQDWLLFDTDFNWRVLGDEGGELRAVADIGTRWIDLF